MSEAICSFANDIRNTKKPGYFLIGADDDGNLDGKVNLENFPNETDYRNPNIAEIMLNLGYVNRFGSGVNTVSTLLEENKSNPAEFLLGDYTTFKVVVQNADVIENGTNATDKKPNVIVNVSEDVTNNDTNGTMRSDKRNDGTISGTISGTMRNDTERYEDIEKLILDKMRADKRVSVKQLSKLFGKSKTSMFRIIDKLKADGKIRRVGSEKSGTWEVIE